MIWYARSSDEPGLNGKAEPKNDSGVSSGRVEARGIEKVLGNSVSYGKSHNCPFHEKLRVHLAGRKPWYNKSRAKVPRVTTCVN